MSGIWLTDLEIQALPVTGGPFLKAKAAADALVPTNAKLSDQDSKHDVATLACALVAVRLGNAELRAKAIASVKAAMGTEAGSRALALGRNLTSYAIAADILRLQSDPAVKAWFGNIRTFATTGGPASVIKCHEQRPNNWGTHAGCARVAIDLFLGDAVDLDKAISVWKGWLGDRASYAGFSYGDKSWQANPAQPVGINPKGATIQGHPVDGVLPDDQRRAGGFTWPPPKENYVHEALQGAVVASALLAKAGKPIHLLSDAALKRAYRWLYDVCQFPASGDDTCYPWLVNRLYAATVPAIGANVGKNMGWTDWTHRPL